MKLFILLSLVLLATSAMANKKCVDMINSSDHTLKMVKHESQTMTEYKEDSLDLYLKVETENRNSDYFQTLKMNLCDSVTSTIEHWNDTHKALASFLNQVEEMIDFRGCKMKKDLLFHNTLT